MIGRAFFAVQAHISEVVCLNGQIYAKTAKSSTPTHLSLSAPSPRVSVVVDQSD